MFVTVLKGSPLVCCDLKAIKEVTAIHVDFLDEVQYQYVITLSPHFIVWFRIEGYYRCSPG